jgi:hypothetical protein
MKMKRIGRPTGIFTIILINLFLMVSSCDKNEELSAQTADEKTSSFENTSDPDCLCIINPADTIFEHEISMLEFMREEEKLARDVYLSMYELYSIPIFKNIAKSESWHMKQVLCLLEYYNIPDPASPDTGIFNNPDLQALYDALIVQGSATLVEALMVGATIEDVDIFDLGENMAATSNEAILTTFERLSCGSGNHIRSFSALLAKKGVTYVPQYISQEEYDEIISLPHQFCGGQ